MAIFQNKLLYQYINPNTPNQDTNKKYSPKVHQASEEKVLYDWVIYLQKF